jgi:hypothetical protein
MKRELLGCAAQMAVVGWGRGSYGEVTVDGVKRSLTEIFDDAGVYYGNDPGTNLEPDDLTPRRIVRVFRFQIQRTLERKRATSFLVRKYGHAVPEASKYWVFPGAEHIVTERQHANALIACYSELDRQQGSHFTQRIKVVLTTRHVEFD